MKSICLLLMVATLSTSAQWTPTNGPIAGMVTGVTVANGAIYACSNNAAIFRSTDEGVTWSFLSGPTEQLFMHELDQALGVLFIPASRSIYRSTDEGRTWTTIANRKLGQYRSLMTIADTIYLAGEGLHRSSDRGETWEEIVDTSFAKRIFFNAATMHGTTFFGATSDGLVAHDLNTKQWRSVFDGYTDCVSSNGTTLLASRIDTLFRSTVDGWSWKKQGPRLYPQRIVAHRKDFYLNDHEQGLFVSNDEGLTWSPLLRNWFVGYINDYEISDRAVYAATNIGLYRGDGSTAEMQRLHTLPASYVARIIELDSGLLTSHYSDGVNRYTPGVGWEQVVNADTTRMPGAPIVRTGEYLVALAKNYGILHSADNGRTWVRKCSCFPYDEPEPIFTVFAAGDTVYLSTARGVYRSTDNAHTFTLINTERTSTSCITGNGTTLWSASYANGLWSSEDKGATWTHTWTASSFSCFKLLVARDSLYAATGAGVLVFDLSGTLVRRMYDSTRVYDLLMVNGRLVAATKRGVYIDDERVSEELPSLAATAVAVFNGDLYVAFEGAGVWKHNLWTVSSVASDQPMFTDSRTLEQLITSVDRVFVLDLRGNEVVDAAGSNVMENISSLPRGVYVIKFEKEGVSRTLKLLK